MAMMDKVRALTAPGSPEARAKITQNARELNKKKQQRSARERIAKSEVEWTPDLQRVLELPRRDAFDIEQIVQELTARFKRPEGTQTLRGIQAWVLWEMPKRRGGIGQIAVSAGKTLMDLLMPMAMPGCKRAVLFVPASVRSQLLDHDWDFYGKHWVLPNLAGGDSFVPGRPVLHVVTYHDLQQTEATALIDELKPDLVIGDEIDLVRNSSSARGKRFLRYFVDNPETLLCCWSGSLTTESLTDYAHLSALSLSDGSPLPIEPEVVKQWSAALDAGGGFYVDPGALRKFCYPGEDARAGFRRRLADTPGFIITTDSMVDAKLAFIERRAPPLPEKLKKQFIELRRPPPHGWKRPDGEVLTDGLLVAACARQLACGFYYKWIFPHGEPRELKDAWFSIRQSWNHEVREKLKGVEPYLDSVALCIEAAERWYDGGCTACTRGPMQAHVRGCEDAWKQPLWESFMWPHWKDIEHKVYHEQKTVWESDYLLEDAIKWMHEAPGIVWVLHSATGHRLQQLSGFRYFGNGELASKEIRLEKGDKPIIASINAHRIGKNLQHAFWRNLVLSFPASASWNEQMIGRTHRSDQPKEEVEVHFYMHTPELEGAIDKAEDRARYVFETTGSHQKLLYGDWRMAARVNE